MERSGSGCTAVTGSCEHGNEPSVFVNCRAFNHYLRNYQLLRRSLICGVMHLYKLPALLETLFDLIFVYNMEVLGCCKSLALPTSRCILFDGENISFDVSLVTYINSTPPIMIINRIYETQNLLSL
jgi:hypothetical protein